MNKAINGSNAQNLFYFKEYIDNEKLISRIVTNIESKIKLVENYKNKLFFHYFYYFQSKSKKKKLMSIIIIQRVLYLVFIFLFYMAYKSQ